MRLKDKAAIVVGAGQTPGDSIGNGRATAVRAKHCEQVISFHWDRRKWRPCPDPYVDPTRAPQSWPVIGRTQRPNAIYSYCGCDSAVSCTRCGRKELERLADVGAGLVLGDGKSDDLAKYLEGVH